MTTYLHPDVIARAQALGLKARALVEGLRVGDHKSPYRGFSVEFLQHREYVPGDDVKHIDWKSYGRSERYTIKQYEQETNYAAHLLLDGSRSMLYGGGESDKNQDAQPLPPPPASLIVHPPPPRRPPPLPHGWRARPPPHRPPRPPPPTPQGR